MKLTYVTKFSVLLFFLFTINTAYSQNWCCCGPGVPSSCLQNFLFPGDCVSWCDFLETPNLGAPAGYSDNLCAGSPCEAAMPIEMSYFRAKQNKDHVMVFWGSSSEINNKGFEIQRMSGVKMKWEVIGFVEGYGNSSGHHDYSFEDMTPPPGVNFFRLKQIDFDGTTAYSPVASTKSDTPNEISVWPTLAKNYIILQGLDLDGESPSIIIHDLMGRLVLKQSVNSNFIQITNLPKGHYIANVNQGGKIYALRFLKVQ